MTDDVVTYSVERAVFEDGSDFKITGWLVVADHVKGDYGSAILEGICEESGIGGHYRVVRHSSLGSIMEEYDVQVRTRRLVELERAARDVDPHPEAVA